MIQFRWLIAAVCCVCTTGAIAKTVDRSSPDAPDRTNGQNYKDMVLARCVAKAYEEKKDASFDASWTANELSAFLNYDKASSNDAIAPLVDRYLARDYNNPRLKAHSMGQELRLLKCLDLYHSTELQEQVGRYVPKPNRTYRQEKQ
ncbi:type VI secretion system amidase immunity protein Tai4 [Cupriavidus campinensis]